MELMPEKIPDNACQEYHTPDDHQIFRNSLRLNYPALDELRRAKQISN